MTPLHCKQQRPEKLWHAEKLLAICEHLVGRTVVDVLPAHADNGLIIQFSDGVEIEFAYSDGTFRLNGGAPDICWVAPQQGDK